MIDPKGKNKWVMPALEAAGFSLEYVDGVEIANDPVGIQAFIDAYDAKPEAKVDKIADLKNEAAKRAGTIYGFLAGKNGRVTPSDAEAVYNIVEDLYLSMQPAARGPLVPRLQKFKDIRDEFIKVSGDINDFTTLAEIVAYDEVNTPVWP